MMTNYLYESRILVTILSQKGCNYDEIMINV